MVGGLRAGILICRREGLITRAEVGGGRWGYNWNKISQTDGPITEGGIITGI